MGDHAVHGFIFESHVRQFSTHVFALAQPQPLLWEKRHGGKTE
jgi:hypothetical protein